MSLQKNDRLKRSRLKTRNDAKDAFGDVPEEVRKRFAARFDFDGPRMVMARESRAAQGGDVFEDASGDEGTRFGPQGSFWIQRFAAIVTTDVDSDGAVSTGKRSLLARGR